MSALAVEPLAAALVTPVSGLLLSMADDEAVLGWIDSEWTGIAPLLEEDVAMSSLSQDELGHAQAWYTLLGRLQGTDPDVLAYDRAPGDYRHAKLLDHARGDWAITIARRFLYESADAVRLDALVAAAWSPIAELAATCAREERYHRMHVDTWFERLAAADGEPRDRVLSALDAVGPDAGTVFTPLPDEALLLEAGILAAPMAELESAWREAIRPTLARLGLPPLPPTSDQAAGRTSHGAAFAELHAGFTSVRRSDPGAQW
jgi:ring-1,2-phenylacetyl-CoA epoxidase subunit PaaC